MRQRSTPPRCRAAPAGGTSDSLLNSTSAPPELTDIAAQLAQGRSDYDAALELQNWFRSAFRYDETVDFSGSGDPLAAFVTAKAGFCQQFSTAFALAARSIGMPARVVVGFTPGDSDPGDPTTFAVRGRHAHAWPEVHFVGIGWVPFEPTPGRGDPSTTALTGIPGQQAAPPEGSTGLENVEPTPPAAAPTPTTAPVDSAAPGPANGSDEVSTRTDQSDSSGRTRWPLAVVLLAVGILVALLFVRRRRFTKAAALSQDPVQSAWMGALKDLHALDLYAESSETPVELAARVNETAAVPSLIDLARLESARRWSPDPTAPPAGAAALQAAEEVHAQVDRALARRASPGELVSS